MTEDVDRLEVPLGLKSVYEIAVFCRIVEVEWVLLGTVLVARPEDRDFGVVLDNT